MNITHDGVNFDGNNQFVETESENLNSLYRYQCVKLNKNHGGHKWPLNRILSRYGVFSVANNVLWLVLFTWKRPGNNT